MPPAVAPPGSAVTVEGGAPAPQHGGADAGRALGWAIGASFLFSALIWAANANLADWTLVQRQPGEPRPYPWQLAESQAWSRLTAWGGYLLHQLTIWWLIWTAQRDIGAAPGPRYAARLRPLNVVALGATAGFVLLHFAQTHLFYDGLAQDVPEWTAMWSVIGLLLVVILMENRRRGIAFGIPWGGFVREASDVARRYHGYYFAWATIYTFWYHPMVFTSGHALGFLYMFLLFTQGSLFYTRAHVNRWWTLTLEVLVMVHGVMVALMNADGMWHMFGFGLLGVFVITQAFGLGFKRAVSLSLVGVYLGGLIAFYSQWGWQDLIRPFRIIGGYYVILPLLALGIFVLGRVLRLRR
jgi:hypothetical protein